MNNFKTEQEAFWHGEFGDSYVDRNQGRQIIAGNMKLFSDILARAPGLQSLIEFGANIGNNLQAIRPMLPNAEMAAVEINDKAAAELRKQTGIDVYHQSILEFDAPRQWDMALIKGVLIHIAPDKLNDVYDRLYKAATSYICIVEYYNPTPVQVTYRGHADRLFKRDFAGEMLDRFKDLSIVDYGFVWDRDPVFPLDNVSWFLLKKIGA